jgi:bifunctional non-homologous end joining protein LigD
MRATRKTAPRTQLAKYRAKRDFSKTKEPSGEREGRPKGFSYLIQKHAASRLHYDFRLELDGVLKSWAVTRGPSLNSQDKRLAVHVEDHPVSYGSFEGTIPQGQYGGGTVMLWDQGTWEPAGDAKLDLARGNLTFTLHGKRLKGRWHLVRLRGNRAGDAKRENWLLIKGKDEYANTDGDAALEKFQTSVVSHRGMQGIAKAAGKTWRKGAAREKSAEESVAAVDALEKKKRKRPARVRVPSSSKAAKDNPPAFVPPQLATLVKEPPRAAGWIHEIKFDGYRLIGVKEKSQVRLFTRAGNDWTDRFAPIAEALSRLKAQSAVVDGEAVIEGAHGSSSFHNLQNALSTGDMKRLKYYAFDLIHMNGVDLRDQPLTARKELLEQLLQRAATVLKYSDHFDKPGDEILANACQSALEGIISKQSAAPYRSGRSAAWLKSKCVKEQEFVVGGFTEQPKHPGMLGALLVGYYEKDQLRFAGKVGTGFTEAEGRALVKKLRALSAKSSSFSAVPSDARRGATFIDPVLVAHVNFGEWTPDGRLRHPSFQGLREDKPAREVVREKEKPLGAVAKRRRQQS